MNRVKLGSYAALWLVVAVVNLVFVSRWLAQRAVIYDLATGMRLWTSPPGSR